MPFEIQTSGCSMSIEAPVHVDQPSDFSLIPSYVHFALSLQRAADDRAGAAGGRGRAHIPWAHRPWRMAVGMHCMTLPCRACAAIRVHDSKLSGGVVTGAGRGRASWAAANSRCRAVTWSWGRVWNNVRHERCCLVNMFTLIDARSDVTMSCW